jgi:hypothetical protein
MGSLASVLPLLYSQSLSDRTPRRETSLLAVWKQARLDGSAVDYPRTDRVDASAGQSVAELCER